MKFLMQYIRYIVLSSSLILSAALYFFIRSTVADPTLQTVTMTQTFAFCAVIYLYLALLPSPLYHVFPSFPFRALWLKARRAIGVSAFFFALIHVWHAFFGELGGLNAVLALRVQYLLPILYAATSFFILFLMTITSTNYAVVKLGKNWKRLHRFVYLASLLIVIHALSLGSHFVTLSAFIPVVFFAALVFLLLLEAIRFVHYLQAKGSSINN